MRMQWKLAAGAVALAVAVVGVQRQPARPGPIALPPPADRPEVPASAPTPADWPEVIGELDAMRADGFADPATAEPLTWADERCGCLAVDRAALRALATAGRSLDAVPPRVTAVVAATGERTVRVTFVDELPAYDELDGSGRVVRSWPGRGPRRWRGVLVQGAHGWRWRELQPVDDHDPAHGVDRGSRG